MNKPKQEYITVPVYFAVIDGKRIEIDEDSIRAEFEEKLKNIIKEEGGDENE